MLKAKKQLVGKVLATPFGELTFDENQVTKDVTKAQAEELASKIPDEFEVISTTTPKTEPKTVAKETGKVVAKPKTTTRRTTTKNTTEK